MTSLSPEYYLQQIVTSERTTDEDEEKQPTNPHRDLLSANLRKIARAAPRYYKKPGFCPLNDAILFLTSEDGGLGEEDVRETDFHAFFYTDEYVYTLGTTVNMPHTSLY